MNVWLSTQEFIKITEVPRTSLQRIIASGRYKGQSLITKKSPLKKGKPAVYVYWNTETNEPAQLDDDNVDNLLLPDIRSVQDRHNAASDGCIRAPIVDTNNHAPTQQSAMASEAQAALQPVVSAMTSTENTEAVAVALPPVAELIEGEDGEALPDFETLLYRKLQGKPASTQRSLRAYYRRQYAATGEMPAALFVGEGRRLAGRKSQLDSDIQSRFIDMVIKSADKDDIFNYYTKGTRKITVFHPQLEKEFGRKINIQQLYTIARACNLKSYLDIRDDEEDSLKTPGFFKAEPVGSIVQMDGVEADYLEILVDGKWRKPIWIEFFDLGSRKLLAMHAYLSESSANSVDIFTRFLLNNAFARQHMKIRPDQAGGFRNLRRPIKELNNCYALPDGFAFIDDFARAGTPKDKAHLESSHRAFHSYEGTMIKFFNDRIDSQYKKTKKTGNQLKTVTVTRLAISLEELNASGITEQYMAHHNSNKHRFQEDGTQRSWAPDDRWNAHLTANSTFNFTAQDAELCRRYGYSKAKATISKEGTITYLKKRYSVADKALWSRHSPTHVKISHIDDHLAIFMDSDEGIYLGDALALVAPVKSEKLIAHEKAKVHKIHSDNEFILVIKELESYGMIVDKGKEGKGGMLQQMLTDGLTLDIIKQLLAEDADKYRRNAGSLAGFNMFASRVKRYLSVNKPVHVVPYAGAPDDEKK